LKFETIYAHHEVKCSKMERRGCLNVRTLQISDIMTSKCSEVEHWHFTSWKDFTVPKKDDYPWFKQMVDDAVTFINE
jgi:protein tyrosine phosphatase